jgi:flagellar FliJ protein
MSPEKVEDRWILERYAMGLKIDATRNDRQVRMLTQIAEDARKLLAARSVDRKIMEKLKERQRIQHDRVERLNEQRFNDETATRRYKAPAF